MKIVRIFENTLFSLHYGGENTNEFEKIMNEWTDINYLKDYADQNQIKKFEAFAENIIRDVEGIEDFFSTIQINKESFQLFFEPLQYSERKKTLALQKGKIRRNSLRIYAIKIDDCFLITGGAIKMSQTMQEHPDTSKELFKLQHARQYLQNLGIISEETFFELNIEVP